jgi:hypothetical protein
MTTRPEIHGPELGTRGADVFRNDRPFRKKGRTAGRGRPPARLFPGAERPCPRTGWRCPRRVSVSSRSIRDNHLLRLFAARIPALTFSSARDPRAVRDGGPSTKGDPGPLRSVLVARRERRWLMTTANHRVVPLRSDLFSERRGRGFALIEVCERGPFRPERTAARGRANARLYPGVEGPRARTGWRGPRRETVSGAREPRQSCTAVGRG